MFGWFLLEFSGLTTFKVISGWVLILIVCTDDNFIVLPHWEIRFRPDIPFSHIMLTLS